MSSRQFYLDEAEYYLDTVVCSDRDKRAIAQEVDNAATHLTGVASEQYTEAEDHFHEEVAFALRIREEGEGRVDEILTELRNGEITAKEAAAQLAEARRDLNKVREGLKSAIAREASTFEQINKSPAEYQRDVARRFPALYAGGRGLLNLPTYD